MRFCDCGILHGQGQRCGQCDRMPAPWVFPRTKDKNWRVSKVKEVNCHCGTDCVFQGDIGEGVEEYRCPECQRVYQLQPYDANRNPA